MNTVMLPAARTSSPNLLGRLWKVPGYAWQILIALAIYWIVARWILASSEVTAVDFRVDFTPLLEESLAVQLHVAGALSALLIGVWILVAPKGNTLHRTLGYGWVAAMALTAVSSFFIRGLMGDSFSPIHAISAWTMVGLPLGVAAARRKDIKAHRKHMTGMFVGAMVIAGLFTFLPGRLMWHLFFTA